MNRSEGLESQDGFKKPIISLIFLSFWDFLAFVLNGILQPQVFPANHRETHSSKKNSVTVTWVMSTQAVNFQATKYILVQDKTETKWLKHTKIKRDLCLTKNVIRRWDTIL